MTPAGKIQNYLKQKVQNSGGQYRKARWENRRGCPDCFVWWEWPQLAFIEVKAEGDRFSAIQDREVERMRHAGIPVYTVRCNADVDYVIGRIRNGEHE